ncbi:MAG: hypothetical protein KF690_08015 [Bacteroidetes bacterium]|nr:hypothetical protein [Bacteroidota bacterium]
MDTLLYQTENGYVVDCPCPDHPPILLVFGNWAVYLETDAFLGLTDFMHTIDSACFRNNMPHGRKIIIRTGLGNMFWLMNEPELEELRELLAQAVLAYRVRKLVFE